jgi:uncharacterized protein (TIGR03437 family)
VGINRLSFLAASSLFFFVSFANAAPQLRLSATTLGPISIAQGANGPATSIEAANIGDGQLALSASSSASWLAASVGAQRVCSTIRADQCFPINITLNTASLPQGLSTAVITLSASSSTIDAPQNITVTVQMGGPLPNDIHATIGQGKSADFKFYTNKFLNLNATTTGVNWASVVVDGVGSFQFGVPYHIHLAPAANMAVGDYSTTVALNGSSDPIDNKRIGVFLRVTDQPVALPSTDKVTQKLAVGAPPVNGSVTLTNIGLGTLTVSDVKVNNAAWLKATPAGPGAVLTFDVTGLSPGTYTGSVTFTSNSVTSVPDVPVELTVVPQGPPTISFNGVVDNAIFGAGDALTSGDVAVVLGDQLSFGPLTVGPAPPLATTIGGAQVLVNGFPAPMYYASYNQLAFQMPFGLSATKDASVQVVRDGQAGNTVSVKIAPRAPRMLLVGGSPYGAITFGDGVSYPFPDGAFPGLNTRPAHAGDVLVIYAIGLGGTNPGVLVGDPAPSTTLSQLINKPIINFFNEGQPAITATPSFAGLTPGFAGLYQVNVTVPSNAPKGSTVNLTLGFNDAISNPVQIAIQ